jgi:hypothetical protein
MTLKRIFLTLLIVGQYAIVSAQSAAQLSTSTNADFTVLSENAQIIDLQFTLDGYSQASLTTSRGQATIPSFSNAARLLVAGAPDLPRISRSLIVSTGMEVEVLSSSFYEVQNVLIAPSKGNLTRNIDPETLPYIFGSVYSKDAFFPGQPAVMTSPYVYRDYQGQVLSIQPLQYNPVSKVLRVYTSMTLRVKPHAGIPALLTQAQQPVAAEFHETYQRHFLNYSPSKYTALNDAGSMLIIAHSSFMAAMQPFIEWKIMRGMPVEMVSVTTAGGTASAIKTYIQNYYNTHPGLVFVLLVGDATQVPTNTVTAGHSDNAYGYLLGNDSYPELIIGRFSAETVAHVNTLVERSVAYERSTATTGSWLANNIGIASEEGPGDDNEMDFQHIRNLQTDLIIYNYNTSVEFFEGSQGGLDAAGDPTPSQVAAAINAGASAITYCGHGSTSSWGTSGFSNTNIATLSNVNKLPFIFSVACVNGNFVGNTCFAEAWTRATLSDAPTGAVAALMSTINQSWNPPMDAQDEMIDILTETYSSNIRRSFGGIAMNGCMHMNDQYGSGGSEMTDTWTIFGDPSLQIRTSSPVSITATHSPVMPLGSSQFMVGASLNGAKAVISLNNQIVAVADVVAGVANLSFLPLTQPDTVTLVVWGYNAIPYIALVPLIPASGPYVVFNSKQVNDVSGNNNALADYGESISLNITLNNVGISQADSVYGILASNDPYVQIIDSTHLWGNISNGATLAAIGAFSVLISDAVPDQHNVQFSLSIHDNSNQTWVSYFTLTCQAPVLAMAGHSWDDSKAGNGNGKPEPGEVLILTVEAVNRGHSGVSALTSSLHCLLPQVGINPLSNNFTNLSISDTARCTFVISLDTTISAGTILNLAFMSKSGAYTGNGTLAARLGIVSEDFETGNLTKFSWTTGGNSTWAANSSNPFEGTWSARSGAINHSQSTQLTISMNVTSPDSISFFKRVSCEEGSSSGQKWDYLEFFIDNVSMGWWDGEVNWSREAYAVAPGNHTFKWLYAKDPYVAAGSDCAWIDYVVFPMQGGSGGWQSWPYLLGRSLNLVPAAGNGNQYAEPGESFYVDLDVVNIGQASANSVKVVLRSNDPDVLVSDSVQMLGMIPGRDSLSVLNSLNIAIPASLNTDKDVMLKLYIHWDTARVSEMMIPLRVYGASTGLAEDSPAELKLWPNPASTVVFADLSSFGSSPLRIDLLDSRGRQILLTGFDMQLMGSVGRIALPAGLSAGTYHLRISDGHSVRISTLLIVQN